MSHTWTRRGALALLGGTAFYLAKNAEGQVVWQVDPTKCVNSKFGEVGGTVCNLCHSDCVVTQSAVRAVNECGNCGRCNICPAYYNVQSAVDRKTGQPSEKLCPRDAIQRKAIGEIDPNDPANTMYEYIIDEKKCDGCGKCVMACKEPAGLGSIQLRVRHDLCVNCNRCSISMVCPKDAIHSQVTSKALNPFRDGGRA